MTQDEQAQDGRLFRRREHLLSEIDRTAPTARRRVVRATLVAAISIGGLAGGGAVVATASAPAVHRGASGLDVIDGSNLQPYYNGARVTPERIRELRQEHKAMFELGDMELACQGIELFVDTQAQADAYSATTKPRMLARVEAMRAAHEAGRTYTDPPGDPCAGLPTAPPVLPAP